MNTILIIEDDELSMKFFNDLLQAHGFKTLLSTDGKDAVRLAKEYRPDLILMDIQLPHVSGIEYTKMLKSDEELKAIPILAVTAFAMEGDKEVIFDAGCDGYISKPISVENFLETIAGFLE